MTATPGSGAEWLQLVMVPGLLASVDETRMRQGCDKDETRGRELQKGQSKVDMQKRVGVID